MIRKKNLNNLDCITTKNNFNALDRIKSDINKLCVEDRSRLIKELLQSPDIDLSVVRNFVIVADVDSSIQSSSDADLSKVFVALAQRVSNSNF